MGIGTISQRMEDKLQIYYHDYLDRNDFMERINGILARPPGEFFFTNGHWLVTEQGPDALVRGVADGR